MLSHGSGRSFALESLAGSGGSPGRIRQHAGPLLRKDVALTVSLAAAAGAEPGFILDAADHLLGEIGQARDGATTDFTGR